MHDRKRALPNNCRSRWATGCGNASMMMISRRVRDSSTADLNKRVIAASDTGNENPKTNSLCTFTAPRALSQIRCRCGNAAYDLVIAGSMSTGSVDLPQQVQLELKQLCIGTMQSLMLHAAFRQIRHEIEPCNLRIRRRHFRAGWSEAHIRSHIPTEHEFAVVAIRICRARCMFQVCSCSKNHFSTYVVIRGNDCRTLSTARSSLYAQWRGSGHQRDNRKML